MEHNNSEQGLINRHALGKKLDTVSWGLFFIWIGISLMAHIGWGAGLLGMGIIILGTQVARKYFSLKLAGFWVVVGFFFIVGGVWALLQIRLGLLPFLCIAAGLTLLLSTLVGKPGGSVLCRLRSIRP